MIDNEDYYVPYDFVVQVLQQLNFRIIGVKVKGEIKPFGHDGKNIVNTGDHIVFQNTIKNWEVVLPYKFALPISQYLKRIDKGKIPKDIFLNNLSEIFPPKPQKCLITLFDILGTKYELERCKDDQNYFSALTENLIKGLYPALSSFHQMISGVKNSHNIPLVNSFHIYSDHALSVRGLGFDLSSKIEDIYGMILFLSNFQLEMVTEGHLVRGVVTVDNAYTNDILLIYPNLLKIHETEKEIYYPFIKIEDEVFNLLKSSELEYIQNFNQIIDKDVSSSFDIKELILKIENFGYIVNYLSLWDVFDLNDNSEKYFFAHKEIIMKNINSQLNLSVIEKYRVLIAYHNYICKEIYPENNELIIDEDILKFNFLKIRDFKI